MILAAFAYTLIRSEDIIAVRPLSACSPCSPRLAKQVPQLSYMGYTVEAIIDPDETDIAIHCCQMRAAP